MFDKRFAHTKYRMTSKYIKRSN